MLYWTPEDGHNANPIMSVGAERFNSLLDQTFVSDFTYEFWPAIDPSSKKILIVLHGRGDSIEGFHFLPAALDLDSLNTLFLQAPDEWHSGYSWYDMPPHQAPGVMRSRLMMFALLDELQKVLGIRADDIFIFGFSQGSLICMDVALRYPKVLGGVICVSGYVFFEHEYPKAFSSVACRQRIWVSHGHQDNMVPFDRTAESIERLRSLGLLIDWVPLNKEHTVDEYEEIPLIRQFINTQLEAN